MDIQFSVIIPFYNAEKTIERALASLISNRTYIKEVILIDDHSTDKTIEKINPFKIFLPISVISNTGKQGPGPARKMGILKANSEWITFLDADDEITASSFYYMVQQIKQNPTPILWHSQTMYLETGSFDAEDIGHSDGSCGGNFYKKQFLLDNNLFPDDELYMSEDNLFNEKIMFFIDHVKNQPELQEWYDYPIYIVHHDLDDSSSFSFDNWEDYICRYHIEGVDKVVQFFLEYPQAKEALIEYFYDGFIFGFYLYSCVLCQHPLFKRKERRKYREYFRAAMKTYVEELGGSKEKLLNYYNTHPELVEECIKGAEASCGEKVNPLFTFEMFVKLL